MCVFGSWRLIADEVCLYVFLELMDWVCDLGFFFLYMGAIEQCDYLEPFSNFYKGMGTGTGTGHAELRYIFKANSVVC